MRFEQPIWLLLGLLVIPVVWTGLRWFVSMGKVRRVSAVVLRSVLIALVAGMLAGVSTVRVTNRLATIGVMDVSDSVRRFARVQISSTSEPEDAIAAAADFFELAAADRGPDDLLGMVVFDGRSLAVATPTRGDISDRTLDLKIVEGTDIEQALRYAAALVPPDASGRLVLLSDGNETAGNALEAAAELSSGVDSHRSGVEIDVAPLAYNVSREVIIESVDAPPRAAGESTITVRVLLRTTDGGKGTLRLLREGEPVDINGAEPGLGRSLTLPVGPHVELVSVKLEPGKIHRFEAVFEPYLLKLPDGTTHFVGDTHTDNNRGQAFTITPGKGSVLVLDGVGDGTMQGPGGTLAHTLFRSGVDVEMMPAEGCPQTLLELEAYDLIILQNVPAEALPLTTHEHLSAFVRDLGGGLVMIGGPDSFGAGGWKGSAVEPILPVKLDLPEELITPDVAIVIVLDNSGSMARSVMGSSRSQQRVANEAAALAVSSLDKQDLVGVISFNNSSSVVVELAENTDPVATAEKIRSIASGGGTNLMPALNAARNQLAKSDAKVKHVIVLSDGRSMGAEALPGYAQQMYAEGIAVSTIAVGDGSDTQTLEAVAESGGGKSYYVINPSVLPRIFLKAVRIARKPMIREGLFTPFIIPSGSPLVAGISQTPPLRGLVLTQARDEPTITYAMVHPDGEPLLAHWNVGLGQVAAFTSDAIDGWATSWIGWDGYERFWLQIVGSISRAASTSAHELTTQVSGDVLRIRLDAMDEDGRGIDLLSVPTTVYPPLGDPVELSLNQTGPGVYEGHLPAGKTGSYVVVAKPRRGGKQLSPVIGGASVASGLEARRLQSNVRLLQQIAETTGGRVLDIAHPESADLFDRSGVRPTEAMIPLWRSLLVWTLIVLLLDVGTRRVAWDRYVSKEFGVGFKQMASDSMADRSEKASGMLASLKGRGRKPVAPAATAFTKDDAARVASQEAKRRRDAQIAAAKARRKVAMDAPEATPASEKRSETKDEAEDAGTSGLLAAKRRAQQRFDSPGGSGDGHDESA